MKTGSDCDFIGKKGRRTNGQTYKYTSLIEKFMTWLIAISWQN